VVLYLLMRKAIFANKEFYHVYNRGVDKRDIVLNEEDVKRFLLSMVEFNVHNPIGSIRQNSFRKSSLTRNITIQSKQLVNFICYCLNPNHYHFILEQVVDKGITKFMQRFGTGYTNYFNNKYQRTGVLFQGKFKAVHITTDAYLLHLSAYVNLNNRVHQLRSQLRSPTSKLGRSSWKEYIKSKEVYKGLSCKKEIVTEQFRSIEEYKKFAEDSLHNTLDRKASEKDLSVMLLE